MKKTTILLVSVLMTLSMCAQGVLTVSGRSVVDTAGHPIIMRGVNLGGWLVTEDWMCGITDTTDSEGRSARKTLEAIYPDSMVAALFNTWEDHWITPADMDTIRSLGFNFVRVPFGWRNLQNQQQQWYLDSTGNIDFSRFDWIVAQAAQRNMYVLFDFHIWLNQDLAYNGISGTDSVIESSCRIWKVVATHFHNNPGVLGYDLLNEPTGSAGDYVMQMIYDTVRAADPAHIIALEWVSFDTSRWHNVLYEDHWYGLTAPTLDSNEAYFDSTYLPVLLTADSLDVPYYIGETQVPDDSSYAWSLNEYCLYSTNWSPWTYKTINEWGWGMISIYPNNADVNLLSTPYDTILSRWSQVSNAANWYELQNVKAIWSNAANCVNPANGIVNPARDIMPLLYPNPAADLIQVSIPPAIIGCHFDIVNALGESVSGGQLTSFEQVIDIGSLAEGLYYLRISGDQPCCLKFVKD